MGGGHVLLAGRGSGALHRAAGCTRRLCWGNSIYLWGESRLCCVWPHGPLAPVLTEGWESVHPHELGLASSLAHASWGWIGAEVCVAL